MRSFEWNGSESGGPSARAGLQGDAFNSFYKKGLKRFFDVAFALILLPVIVPVIALLWCVVSLDGQNAFFGHRRIGMDGKAFKCWKIRTMVVDAERKLQEHLANDPQAAEEWARDQKLTNDPRVTRLGQFLRKTSLDELPQIWNVLKGEMSFVGPRPIVRTELQKYGVYRNAYKTMKPGITGLWQVSGRNDVSYDERVMMDLDYMIRASFGLDMRIILGTASAVLGRTGR